ncbi:hypothetical protein DFH09DRAFT_1077062 [Mycena vulgaris]|nr:hypothetical protein DFH09DRAFT_1077062 [Mycena vulgaris]
MNPNLVLDASGPPMQPTLLFDTSQQQQYEPTAQPYDNSGQTYHPSGQPYEQYDPTAQPYNSSGQTFHASGQPYEQYDPTAQPYDSAEAYDTSAQRYDVSAGQHLNGGGQHYNAAAPQVAVPEEGWFEPAPVDVAGLVASNQQLLEKIARAEEWGQQATNEYEEMKAERNAAQAKAVHNAKLVADTMARLERLELAQRAPANAHSPPAPRRKPASAKAMPTPATPAKASKTTAPPKTTPATPSQGCRASGQPKQPAAQPSNPPRSEASAPQSSRSSPTPPRPSAKKSSSSTSSTNGAGDLPKATRGSAKATAPDSASSPTSKAPRKPAEHQMFKDDVSPEARSFKTTLTTHIHFIGNNLVSGRAPSLPSPADIQHFNRRFEGMTVTELKRQGALGQPIIKASEVKLGISVEDAIRSRNKIVCAFCQLEESALLHIKGYFAKLGIKTWAVDYAQSAYSTYNMVMRMAAIDSFRWMVSASYYDFLRPNTSFIHDSVLVIRVYDHFTHKYQFGLWKKEIRMPGGNALASERNKYSKTHLRLFGTRDSHLKDTNIRKGLRLMFHPKATSDTETDNTPNGRPLALAREERSQAADQIIRRVDGLILQDLKDDGKTVSANARTTDYFSRRNADNKLSIPELTEKYGDEVFGQYDLDFEPDAEGAEEDDEGEADGEGEADDEGEGDEVGSEDSDEEANSSDAGSVAEFLDDAGEQDDDMDDYSDGDAEGEDDDDEAASMAQFAQAMDDDEV